MDFHGPRALCCVTGPLTRMLERDERPGCHHAFLEFIPSAAREIVPSVSEEPPGPLRFLTAFGISSLAALGINSTQSIFPHALEAPRRHRIGLRRHAGRAS